MIDRRVSLALMTLAFVSACKRDVDTTPAADESARRETAREEESQGLASDNMDGPVQDAPRTDEQIGNLTPASRVERKAEANFKAAKGIKLAGVAKFIELGDGVRVSVELTEGPKGTKGIHIHEKGDCSNIAGKSMGEHFNPLSKSHGLPTSPEKHAGDLGNIEIEKDGTADLRADLRQLNLKPEDPMSLVGKSVVIHMSEDVGTPPSGKSGTPIACARIEAVEE